MTRRRVIFPDPEIWTHRKELVMIEVKAADVRRAAALYAHYGAGNDEGLNAIWEDAVSLGRVAELLIGTLFVFNNLVPLIFTENGVKLMQGIVGQMATRELAEEDDQ